MRRDLTLVICVLMLASLVAGAACANPTILSKTYSVNVAAQKTDWVKTLSLPQFDSSLGQLVGVSLKIAGNLHGTVGMQNLDDAQSQSLLVHLGTQLTMKRGTTTQVAAPLVFEHTYTLDAYDGSTLWWGPSDGGVEHPSQSASSGLVAVTGSFNDYIGTGTFGVNVSATGNSYTEGSGNVASYYQTTADATATVEYLYEAAEPGTLIALCSGMLGLGGFALRRRK